MNGGLVAIRATRVDLVGVVALGMATALVGDVVRDVLLGDLPPAGFADWGYLAVALAASVVAFLASVRLVRYAPAITALDAAGLSLFAMKAIELGVGARRRSSWER